MALTVLQPLVLGLFNTLSYSWSEFSSFSWCSCMASHLSAVPPALLSFLSLQMYWGCTRSHCLCHWWRYWRAKVSGQPWGTPLITGSIWTEPLPATLWLHPSHPFLSLPLKSNSRSPVWSLWFHGKLCLKLSEAQADYTSWSSLFDHCSLSIRGAHRGWSGPFCPWWNHGYLGSLPCFHEDIFHEYKEI